MMMRRERWEWGWDDDARAQDSAPVPGADGEEGKAGVGAE